MAQTDDISKSLRQSSATELPEVGYWPEPAPRWGVVLSGILWLAWAGFLVWMMVLRISSDPAKVG